MTTYKIDTENLCVEYDSGRGIFNSWIGEKPLFTEAVIGFADGEGVFISGSDPSYRREVIVDKLPNPWTEAQVMKVIYRSANLPTLAHTIYIFEDKLALGFDIEIINESEEDIYIRELYPLRLMEGGNLLIFSDPKSLRVLQGHYWMTAEENYRLRSLEDGKPVRNWWTTAIASPSSKEGLVAGILSAANTEAAIITRYSSESNSLELVFSGGCYLDINKRHYETEEISPDMERRPLRIPPGNLFKMSPVILIWNSDIFQGLKEYSETIKTYNNIKLPPHPPAGLFTGYSIDKKNERAINLNERAIEEWLEFLQETSLRRYGIEYIKIEFGFEGSPTIFNPYEMNRLGLRGYKVEKYFPKGIKALVDEIHRRGFKAAWQSRTFLYVKGGSQDEDERTRGIYKRAVEEWGFDYLMLDFNYTDLTNSCWERSAMDLIRHRFEVIREAVGDDIFIEACMIPFGPIMEVADGFRPSSDFRAGLDDYLLKGFKSRYYLNGYCFYNDAEFFDVSERPFPPQRRGTVEDGWVGASEFIIYPMERTKAWLSLIGIAGLSLFCGGYLPASTAERWNLYKKFLPVYPIGGRPVDLFENELPRIWDLKMEKKFGSWNVVGLFNWSDEEEQEISIDFKELYLDSSEKYLLFDFWRSKFLGEFQGSFSATLQPRSCLVLALHRKSEVPKVISTDRHITQGGIELIDVKWDEANNTLRGISKSPKNTSHNIFIYLPKGYEVGNLSGCEMIEVEKDILKVAVGFDASKRREWMIVFNREER